MRKIAIIGANAFQNPLILKVKEMGYESHVFAWQENEVGEQTADFFYPISIIEKDKILETCKTINPDAVLSIGSDLAAITVNYVAKNMGFPCNSEYCTLVSTNKFEMRKAFREANISTPEFHIVSSPDQLNHITHMSFPLIIKPTDRSGSRGITKISGITAAKAAIQDAIQNSFENKAIVEEYIEGKEYSCECISYDGDHHLLAVTEKYTTGAPHFIEVGHIQPSGLDRGTLEQVRTEIFHALDALDIKYGASHSEFKIDEHGKVKIIEIGARMGGDCIGSDLVKLSTGYDFLEMTIQAALGKKPTTDSECSEKSAAIRFIFNEDDLNYLNRVRSEHPSNVVYVSDIDIKKEHNVIDSSSRYGFYILSGDSREEMITLAHL